MTWELTDRSDKGRTSASVERTDPQDWPYVIWTPFPPFALGESGLLASNERVAKFAVAAPDMYAALEEAEALVVAWACHHAMQGVTNDADLSKATSVEGWHPTHRAIYEHVSAALGKAGRA